MTTALRVLADENINPAVVAGLRSRGWDVRSVAEEQLVGAVDADVLARAIATDRVVITHDLAFGRDSLALAAPFVGITYLTARPPFIRFRAQCARRHRKRHPRGPAAIRPRGRASGGGRPRPTSIRAALVGATQPALSGAAPPEA